MKLKITILSTLISLFLNTGYAQTRNVVESEFQPIKININQDGSRYIRFLLWNQMWFKYTQNNDETMDINLNRENYSEEFGIRRARIMLLSQMTSRFLFLAHFGIDNQTYNSGGAAGNLGTGSSGLGQGGKRPQLYLHDIWGDYSILGSRLKVGAGLHYWNGISRMTNASTISIMTLDLSQVANPNFETTSQFGRQLGFFAHGELGKLNYRFSVNKPFAFGIKPQDVKSFDAQNTLTDKWATQAYLFYQFMDREGSVLPYLTGTYLGNRKIFNLGMGYYHHPDYSTNISRIDSSIELNTELVIGLDAYADLPLRNGMSLNFYSAFYMGEYGPNYVHSFGVMNNNPAVNTTLYPHSAYGGGNAQPMIGSGNTSYTQIGFLLPKFRDGSAFMPYASFTYKDFEAFDKATTQYDLGLNFFLRGHNVKFTGEYSVRPSYIISSPGANPVQDNNKYQLTFQTQIFM